MQYLAWQRVYGNVQQLQIETLPWPVKLHDLNLIEHLRDELERCLRSRQQAVRNLQELSDAAIE